MFLLKIIWLNGKVLNRNIRVDTLRGLACCFLVLSHTIGGMSFPESSQYFKFIDVFSYIRMPLFTFLSGIVYTYRPFEPDKINKYIKGKFNRLIIPMLIIGSIYGIVRYHTLGAHHSDYNIYTMHIYPVAYFWFVEAILLVFLLMIPIEYFKLFNSLGKGICLILISILISPLFNDIYILSINGFFYLLPYFLFGVFVIRFSVEGIVSYKFKVFLFLFIIITCLLHYYDYVNIGPPKTSYFSFFIGCIFCFVLYCMNLKIKYLSIIGLYSYTIYLYHGFFTSGFRIILSRFNMDNVNFIITICFLAGIFIPIILHFVFMKNRYSSFLLIGLKKR